MKKTIKDYITVLFGTGFSRGVSFLNSIIVARILGPADFGKFSIFFTVMVLTWLFPQAFDATFIRNAAIAESDDEKREYFKMAVIMKIIYSVIAIVISYPLSILLAKYCFQKPGIEWVITLAVISGVFQSFLMTIASIYQEREHFTMFSFFYSFYTVTIFLMLILSVVFGMRPSFNMAIAMYASVSLAIGTVSIYLIFKRKIRNLLPLDTKILNSSFAFGKWIFGTMTLGYLFTRLDLFFLPRYVKFESVGIYFSAQQFILVISVMTGSLSNVFLPKGCKALESRATYARFIKESFIISSAINILVVILIIFAHSIIRVLYGPDYESAGSIMRILLLGYLFSIVYMPFSALFFALGMMKQRFMLEASKFVIALILLFMLVPSYGIWGAAISITITFILNSAVSMIYIKNKVDNHFVSHA
ncbi:MAG: oligosaccharide flippase family protein [Candidatus Omnitrophota bacterium]|jgi:O-antigen/teichoic acid export membrane protein